ncbi:MAG: hypothetical protein ACI845_001284 [Gammaproteobacteria bacterium]|jgi:hypothetical protein
MAAAFILGIGQGTASARTIFVARTISQAKASSKAL